MQAKKVVALQPMEHLQQNSEPIATIYRSLGTASAEQVVSRALAELALTMTGISAYVQSNDREPLARQLRRLQRLADNLGLLSLALVAADLRMCLDRDDSTAFAAIWQRLRRVAERSLAHDIDRNDGSA